MRKLFKHSATLGAALGLVAVGVPHVRRALGIQERACIDVVRIDACSRLPLGRGGTAVWRRLKGACCSEQHRSASGSHGNTPFPAIFHGASMPTDCFAPIANSA